MTQGLVDKAIAISSAQYMVRPNSPIKARQELLLFLADIAKLIRLEHGSPLTRMLSTSRPLHPWIPSIPVDTLRL